MLLGLEAMLPSGFFLFFFGIGAFVTGVTIYYTGEWLQPWIPWALFSLFSITALLFFRAKLKALSSRGASDRAPELSGENCVVTDKPIGPGAAGFVELRGTQWQARNVGDKELSVGARARVTAVTGLTVEVISE